jgi:hypothetical protein
MDIGSVKESITIKHKGHNSLFHNFNNVTSKNDNSTIDRSHNRSISINRSFTNNMLNKSSHLRSQSKVMKTIQEMK